MSEPDICRGIQEQIMSHLPEILSLRNTPELKPDNTFVSKGDKLCEKIIFDFIDSRVRDSLVISEETETDLSRLDEVRYVITVDPIDGTENFVSGLKEWGVGVSVYRRLRHYQSMIMLPELGLTLCTGDRLPKMMGSRICGLSSYMRPEDFAELGQGGEYRIMGCCMYNMYNVIRGGYRQFLHLKGAYSWDILPGLNLALEHGLDVELEGGKYGGEFLCPGVKYCFKIKAGSKLKGVNL